MGGTKTATELPKGHHGVGASSKGPQEGTGFPKAGREKGPSHCLSRSPRSYLDVTVDNISGMQVL